MMKRLWPYPLLWLAMLGMWLLLDGSYSLGQLLLGVIIASLACWAVAAVEPPQPKIRNTGAIARLLWRVVIDVVASNIAVIGLILLGRPPRSVFVTVQLELEEPNALAVLACIVTATPGSAWVHHNSRLRTVMIHVLDTPDGAAWAAALKANYEQRLMEIFQ